MMRRVSIGMCVILFGAAAWSCASTPRAASPTPAEKTTMPRGWTDLSALKRDGRVMFAAQPDAAGLVAYAQSGGVVVIDLRRESEHAEDVGYDEKALTDRLGLRYINIPLGVKSFNRDHLDAFAEVVAREQGPILLHCASGGRSAMVWATYLALKEGLTTDEAIERGRAVGLDWDFAVAKVRNIVDGTPMPPDPPPAKPK